MGLSLKTNKSKLSLKQALLTLMKKKSFNKITIIELCELADLNRSTFYTNYEDINELLFDIHTDLFRSMSEVLGSSRKASSESSYEEYTGKLIKIVKYLEKNKEIFQLLLSNNEDNLFEKNLLDFYMNLYVTENDSYIDRYIFMYHSIGSFSIVSQWLHDKTPCSSEELAKLLCAMTDSVREF